MMKYTTISELLAQYPFLHDFFQQNRLDVSKAMNQTIGEYIEHISEEEAEEKAIHKENLFEEMKEYIAQIQSFLGIEEEERVHSLTILPGQDKIVLMATHDPLLALMADHRIVIKNGGIHEVLETTEEEKELLKRLTKMDAAIQEIRQSLRRGNILTSAQLL